MEIVLAIVSFVSSFFIVLIIVGIGWYFVWKFFLSKFRFVRELLGGMTEVPASEGETRKSRPRKARRE